MARQFHTYKTLKILAKTRKPSQFLISQILQSELMKESTASELAVGSSFGLVGGVMDNRYTEPFGLILGASLLILQLLDHKEMSLYWIKNKRHLHAHRLKENEDQLPTVSEENKLFFSYNLYIGAGLAGGHFARHVMSDIARDFLEDRSKT